MTMLLATWKSGSSLGNRKGGRVEDLVAWAIEILKQYRRKHLTSSRHLAHNYNVDSLKREMSALDLAAKPAAPPQVHELEFVTD